MKAYILSLTFIAIHLLQVRGSACDCSIVEVEGIIVQGQPQHSSSQVGCINDNTGMAHFFSGELSQKFTNFTESDEMRLRIDPCREDEMIEIEDTSTIRIIDRSGEYDSRRALYKREGKRTGLVVRVTSIDGDSPTFSSPELSEYIFSEGRAMGTMRKGFLACSGGKLDLAPAEGDYIDAGVIEITVPHRVEGTKWKTVQNSVTSELYKSGISITNYDNIIMVLPLSVDFEGAAAWAYVNRQISVYSDTSVQFPIVMIHELGHNLGYHHSGTKDSAYGDDSCFMGGENVVWREDVKMCFNAAKSWYANWYADRHLTVTPTALGLSWNGQLIGIDDYVNNRMTDNEQKVIVKIQGDGEKDMFLMFNRAKGINADVLGFPNKVTIVEQENAESPSTLLAALKSQNTLRIKNYANSGMELVIQDCGHRRGSADYAKVRIYLDYTSQDISCTKSINVAICNENPKDRFFLKRDGSGGQFHTRQCQWLLKKQPARLEELCTERGSGQGGFGLPHEVCCKTCSDLLTTDGEQNKKAACKEDPLNRFFLRKNEDGKIHSRQCQWLLNKKPARVQEICEQQGGEGGFKSAREVCCESCSKFE